MGLNPDFLLFKKFGNNIEKMIAESKP